MNPPSSSMARLFVVAALAWTTAGCSTSKLQLSIRRYDTNHDRLTAQAYQESHPREPTVRTRKDQLTSLRRQSTQYKQWVIALNELVGELMPPKAGTAPQDKKPIIDEAFAEFDARIGKELKRLMVPPPSLPKSEEPQEGVSTENTPPSAWGNDPESLPAPPLQTDFDEAWAQLRKKLEQGKVEVAPGKLETVIGELERAGAPALRTRVENIHTSFRSLASDLAAAVPDAAQKIRGVDTALTTATAGNVAPLKAALDLVMEGYQQERGEMQQAIATTQARSADTIDRATHVYQDPTDPFLAFIARYPEGWYDVGNYAKVSGTGDTEFVLVFESPLDGRFKLISVDPTQVILSRVRIARKAAQAIIAIGGVAMGSFGVPVPGLNGMGDKDGTVDYSRMTGAEEQLRERNESHGAELESLRSWAAAQSELTDVAEAQRALEVLLGKLRALPTPKADDSPASP